MTDARNEWTEENSTQYRELANVAVPTRDEQIAIILALIPFAPQDTFRVVELGCGEGVLSFAILDCFLHASVTALDGSPSREAPSQNLSFTTALRAAQNALQATVQTA
jgi:trans-aconitate methyltransferase